MEYHLKLYVAFALFALLFSCNGQGLADQQKSNLNQGGNKLPASNYSIEKVDTVFTLDAPSVVTRTIIKDRNGNIWIAAFDGIYQYDGESFTNLTTTISSARFFSVLEDRKGNFWLSSVGSGVYYYDGISFKNFTGNEGLASDRVFAIHEDNAGKIWFSTEGGLSCYDGKSFRNYTMKEGLSSNDVNWIIEDKMGKFWIGTRGNACLFDGKTFSVLNHDGKPFTNVRSIIEDGKGNIWLGGNEGLWRYDGKTFTNLSRNFVGYIYEDKDGNIWTSSQSPDHGWALSRYDKDNLNEINTGLNGVFSNDMAIATDIKSHEGMIFGIAEDDEGNIWFGTLNGIYRYDGKTTTYFRKKAEKT